MSSPMSSLVVSPWRASRSWTRSWSTTVMSFHCDMFSASMLTLPLRSQSVLWSSRRLSKGSTSIDSRGFTPSGRPAGPPDHQGRDDGEQRHRQRRPGRSRRWRARAKPGTGVGVPPSAERNSAPDWNRSPGALASARMIPASRSAGHSGRTLVSVIGCSEMCLETTTRFGPTNGGCPASIS